MESTTPNFGYFVHIIAMNFMTFVTPKCAQDELRSRNLQENKTLMSIELNSSVGDGKQPMTDETL